MNTLAPNKCSIVKWHLFHIDDISRELTESFRQWDRYESERTIHAEAMSEHR